MTAEQLVREGRLREALEELQQQVRKEPAAAKHRVFLFQLLSVLGQWERAMTQLNVAADLDAGTMLMAHMGRAALNGEALRAEIFAGRRTPMVFGEPAEWVTWMIEANRLTAQGQTQAADSLRARALEAAPAIPGRIDDHPFEWVADADARMGPILEMMINGQYFWVPLQQIRELRIEAPADLRDVVWLPVSCTWINGGSAVGLVPSRYPGSESSSDPAIQMARKTDWVDNGHGATLGLGQRMLATDQGEYALLETRNLVLEQPAPP
ncbi:MAG: type VI secretion system accessory protein TagJ [Lentisphaerota bacterium]